jgi:drug/metabolite transporter (DMT)-like permease
VLAFFQGAPLAMLVMVGVGFASASHVAALLPGLLPLFAASISYVFFGERLSIIRMLGLHSTPAARSRLFFSA